MTIPEACSSCSKQDAWVTVAKYLFSTTGQPVKIWDLAMRMVNLSGLRVGEDIEIVETGLPG